MSDCPEYLIYPERNMWRVACSNGRLYGASGLYKTKEQAITAVETTGCSYKVVEK